MQSGRNRAKCRQRAQGGTLRQRTGARTSPKGAGQHFEATNMGENVAQGRRPALTGNEKGRKRRPRVPPGTHRQRKGAKTLPKGAARHSQATERGINVAQGCRPALTGNEKGHKRRPRVSPSTHRQRKGAKTLPKGAARHHRQRKVARTSPKGAGLNSWATNRGENVAQGRRAAL